MYEFDELTSGSQEGKKITKLRLTPPQKEALEQIDALNLTYPKRWFTQCELERVIPVTLEALVSKGFLITKQSAVNHKVQYWQRTSKRP